MITLTDRLLSLAAFMLVPLFIVLLVRYDKRRRAKKKPEEKAPYESPDLKACLEHERKNPGNWRRMREKAEAERKAEKDFRDNIATIADSIRKSEGKP